MNKVKLMQGDNIESLKKLPENSIDSIVTDPPYGLSFMGKKWDYDVPSVEFWKEAYRVLKPGGHILSFGGTRTYHRMVVNIEDAGFEIRDQIMWLYGSGFPKSHNIGKSVDKIRGNKREVVGNNPNHRTTAGLLELGFQDGKESSSITKGTSEWEGWGTALKPANEPICVARKPISEKTIVANVLKWGTGGINIDGCRIGSEVITTPVGSNDSRDDETLFKLNSTIHHKREETTEGRFPANIILDEEVGKVLGEPSKFFYCPKVNKKERNAGCEEKIIINIGTVKLLIYKEKENILWEKQDQKVKHQVDMEPSIQKDIEEYGPLMKMVKEERQWNTELFGKVFMDLFKKDFKSIIKTETNLIMIYQILNSWMHCTIKENIAMLLKEQMVGINFVENVEQKSTKMTITNQKKDGSNQNVSNALLIEPVEIRLEEKTNSSHPTVKPIELMAYLCRLVTPFNGIVLDPFMGSGSTGCAAIKEGFRFCGMEMDADYFKISESRIENFEKYRP
jgi:DNA modification methylase